MVGYLSERLMRQVPDDVSGQCPYRYLWRVVIDVLYSHDDDRLGRERVMTAVTCDDHQLINVGRLVIDHPLQTTISTSHI